MKAIQYSRFGGPEVLELVELPGPHPDAGQVRVAVRAAELALLSDYAPVPPSIDPSAPCTPCATSAR